MIIVTIYCLLDRLSDNLQYINKCETSRTLLWNTSLILNVNYIPCLPLLRRFIVDSVVFDSRYLHLFSEVPSTTHLKSVSGVSVRRPTWVNFSNGTGNHPNVVTGLIVARDCMLAGMIQKRLLCLPIDVSLCLLFEQCVFQ